MDEQPTWKVRPDGTAWIVEQREKPGVSSRHTDQRAAIREARSLALTSPPSHVVVHDAEGNVIWSVVFSGNAASSDPTAGLACEDGELPGLTGQGVDGPDPAMMRG